MSSRNSYFFVAKIIHDVQISLHFIQWVSWAFAFWFGSALRHSTKQSLSACNSISLSDVKTCTFWHHQPNLKNAICPKRFKWISNLFWLFWTAFVPKSVLSSFASVHWSDSGFDNVSRFAKTQVIPTKQSFCSISLQQPRASSVSQVCQQCYFVFVPFASGWIPSSVHSI